MNEARFKIADDVKRKVCSQNAAALLGIKV